MTKLLTSLSAILFLTVTNTASYAADGMQTTAHTTVPDLQAYDELTTSLLVSLLIIGIYGFYWLKQKA
ncbi:MAG: hypothetical protein M0R33_21550 [Methylomonas sp.]|jgi:hypothetical protein|uniref:hypothetical protein n=1 Tax=Methylomonas sp. TaxID=418 RepID=UPI0025E2A0C4|nr:hypothetical protein [Methylomonas sp.]MCK9609030.1 hypothetical protein [Methylomonas sp.]